MEKKREGRFALPKAEPAYSIVRLFGGPRKVARICGVHERTVVFWSQPITSPRGCGGFIPVKHHDKLRAVAIKAGFGPLRDNAFGKRSVDDMGKAQRAKGDRFEYQVTHDFQNAGFDAHRVPLSGAMKNYIGDVRVKTRFGEWIIQCKISAARVANYRRNLATIMRNIAICRIETPGFVYAMMRRSVLLDYLHGKKVDVVNWHLVPTHSPSLQREIAEHDVLIFRINGATEWVALVPWSMIVNDPARSFEIGKYDFDCVLQINDPAARKFTKDSAHIRGLPPPLRRKPGKKKRAPKEGEDDTAVVRKNGVAGVRGPRRNPVRRRHRVPLVPDRTV